MSNSFADYIIYFMKKRDTRPIGIFDSGVGGLTVLRSLCRELPGERFVYFGDTARVPYGNKSKETIQRFSREIMEFLLKHDVKMVVVACNTASSLALPVLKEEYNIPVVGVIVPGVKEAVRVSLNGRIGVIGTTSTISSGSYEKALLKIAHVYKMFPESCPLFVPLVENGFINDDVTRRVAERYLKGLKRKGIDTLILGCTHYPIIRAVIGRVMKGVRLVDSPTAVAKEVIELVNGFKIASGKKRTDNQIKCFVSDDPRGFERFMRVFLGKKIRVSKAAL